MVLVAIFSSLPSPVARELDAAFNAAASVANFDGAFTGRQEITWGMYGGSTCRQAPTGVSAILLSIKYRYS